MFAAPCICYGLVWLPSTDVMIVYQVRSMLWSDEAELDPLGGCEEDDGWDLDARVAAESELLDDSLGLVATSSHPDTATARDTLVLAEGVASASAAVEEPTQAGANGDGMDDALDSQLPVCSGGGVINRRCPISGEAHHGRTLMLSSTPVCSQPWN